MPNVHDLFLWITQPPPIWITLFKLNLPHSKKNQFQFQKIFKKSSKSLDIERLDFRSPLYFYLTDFQMSSENKRYSLVYGTQSRSNTNGRIIELLVRFQRQFENWTFGQQLWAIQRLHQSGIRISTVYLIQQNGTQSTWGSSSGTWGSSCGTWGSSCGICCCRVPNRRVRQVIVLVIGERVLVVSWWGLDGVLMMNVTENETVFGTVVTVSVPTDISLKEIRRLLVRGRTV